MSYTAAESSKKIHVFQMAFSRKFSYRLVLCAIKRMCYFHQTITFQNVFRSPYEVKNRIHFNMEETNVDIINKN